MPDTPQSETLSLARRRVLALLAGALGLGAGALARAAEDLLPTPSDAEGPFYKPGSPRRASLVDADSPGTRLTITGRVLSTRGTPLAGAKLDFWQTNAHGDYDNRGFRFRGHQYTDARGRYRLETVVPGAYPGRTRHVHVKVAAADHVPLTTQLYFPGDPRNRADFLFNPALLLDMSDGTRGKAGRFDFVLRPR